MQKCKDRENTKQLFLDNLTCSFFVKTAEPIREIAGECGVEFSDEGAYVIDRFNADLSDDGRGTLVVSDAAQNLIGNKIIVGESKAGAPLLYRGVG